jgi:hypothetical protein
MPSTNSGTGIEELRIEQQAIADQVTAARAVLARLQTDLAGITAQFAALNSGAYYTIAQVDQILTKYALMTTIQPFPGTAFGRSVVEAANPAALRTIMQLGSSATRPASDYAAASAVYSAWPDFAKDVQAIIGASVVAGGDVGVAYAETTGKTTVSYSYIAPPPPPNSGSGN